MLLWVTLASIAAAVIMTVVAWRATADARRRSAARVATLAEAIHADPGSLFAPQTQAADLPLRPPADSARDLFAGGASVPGRGSRRVAAGIAFGVFVVGTTAAVSVVVGSGFSRRTDVAAPAVHVQEQPVVSMPIELIALGHERDGSGLIVRGVVRNPAAGVRVDHVAAVVFLFDRNGDFITSARAPIDQAALAPGSESPFRISVPDAANVSRYRVSFRTDDRVIPHVDHRNSSAR